MTAESFPNTCSPLYRTHVRCVKSRERHELGTNLPVLHLEDEHRMDRCAPPLGRAAGIQDPDLAEALDLRYVRVAVDDCVTAGEPSGEPRFPPRRRARHVDDPDPYALDLHDQLLRERLA